jgi:glycosyltransferase involved in cell wall biosynthesis
MKPRILHIIPSAPHSGPEKQVKMLAQGMPLDEFDIQIHSMDNRWKYDPRTFLELKRIVDRFRPDLIHSWTSATNVYALVAAKAAGVKRFVAGYFRIDPFKSSPQLAIDRYVARHSIHLTVNNSGVRDFYVQKGLPAEKFRIIPSGVEPSRPNTTTRRQLLAELGLDENSHLIGLVSRLLPRNRVKDAIWAADLLKVVRKDVHLLVIGDGPHLDQLRRFRKQVRIADFVHFLGQRGDVARLMPHFDMLWSTSPYEDNSNSILEAMAAGVPVVACDTPCSRELIVHGETGFLVPTGNRVGFARHVYQLLGALDLANRIGQAAQERAQRDFPAQKMIAGHTEMYRQMIG